MRNTLALFSLVFTCCAAGALAQPAATNDSTRRIDSAVDVWRSDPNYKQTFNVESVKSLGLVNGAIKSGGGTTMESTIRALPESVRKSAQNPAPATMANLRQIEAPDRLNARVFDAENRLIKRDDVNQR